MILEKKLAVTEERYKTMTRESGGNLVKDFRSFNQFIVIVFGVIFFGALLYFEDVLAQENQRKVFFWERIQKGANIFKQQVSREDIIPNLILNDTNEFCRSRLCSRRSLRCAASS